MPVLQQCSAPPAGLSFSRAGGWGMKGSMEAMQRSVDVDRGRAELAALLRRTADHESLALRTLYERTSAKLYGICVRVLGSESEAQDTLQEVYVTVWQKASQFDPARATAITWLSVLARNKAIDRLRARRANHDDIGAAEDIADDRLSALEVLEQAEDASRLADCLETLDERARSMIRTAFFEGASYPELASRANVPLPTMKSWIRRGLVRLRGCLEQ